MPNLSGKVAVVTGAGRGIGREHALALARAGAKIVVNDLGASLAGEGADEGPAHEVVARDQGAGRRGGRERRRTSPTSRARDECSSRPSTLRAPGHPRQQRRHPPRPDAREHGRARVGRGDRRAPEGPLRADAPRSRVLARALEGGRGRARARDQHGEPVGSLRQRRPGELRRGEGRHRRLHADRRAGARRATASRSTRSRRTRARA